MVTKAIEEMATVDEVPQLLFCDLDDTLIRTDLLWESLVSACRRNPFVLLCVPFWLCFGGRARLKAKLTELSSIDFSALPYNQGLLSYLAKEKPLRSQLVLATASNIKLAKGVAAELGLFDQIIASDDVVNLKGSRKLRSIQEMAQGRSFEYIGDSKADVAIWRSAGRATIVGHRTEQLTAAIRGAVPVKTIAPDMSRNLAAVFKLIRPHQWVKNFLVFIPLFAAHAVFDMGAFLASCVAFMAFSLTASAGYVINDLCDVTADRHHAKKRFRPLAAGTVSFLDAIVTLGVLLCAGIILASFLPYSFSIVLGTYFVTTFCYSLFLKSKAILDVVFLAILYVIRIVGGHEATGLVYSPWLLIFSMFFFSSLAFIKRYSEIRTMDATSSEAVKGRGYVVSDLAPVMSMGSSAGYLSLLVLAQYIYSDQVTKLYAHPHILLLLLPLFLFWISRMWLLASRGEMHHDPVVFAITDRVSLLVAALSVVVVMVASQL